MCCQPDFLTRTGFGSVRVGSSWFGVGRMNRTHRRQLLLCLLTICLIMSQPRGTTGSFKVQSLIVERKLNLGSVSSIKLNKKISTKQIVPRVSKWWPSSSTSIRYSFNKYQLFFNDEGRYIFTRIYL